MTTNLAILSAYTQLSPMERDFVDRYVERVEQEALSTGQRISNFLYLDIPDNIIKLSRGLLEKPMVKAAISERITEIAQANDLTAQRIVKELSTIAFSSVSNYVTVNEYGIPEYNIDKCTPEQLAAIKIWKHEERLDAGRKIEIQTHDKLKAIEMLAKYMGLFESNNPYWRDDNAKPENAINTIDQSVIELEDEYARLLSSAA